MRNNIDRESRNRFTTIQELGRANSRGTSLPRTGSRYLPIYLAVSAGFSLAFPPRFLANLPLETRTDPTRLTLNADPKSPPRPRDDSTHVDSVSARFSFLLWRTTSHSSYTKCTCAVGIPGNRLLGPPVNGRQRLRTWYRATRRAIRAMISQGAHIVPGKVHSSRSRGVFRLFPSLSLFFSLSVVPSSPRHTHDDDDDEKVYARARGHY